MIHSSPLIIFLLFSSLVHVNGFQAIAYGSRVFTESADAFLGFDEEVGDVVIAEGNAILTIPPSVGTIKQSNCIDVVDVEGVISFSNEELSFCYEGGPQMVEGATDTVTFDIVGNDGITSTYEARFTGSDPVDVLDSSERLVLTQENVPVTINVGTAFAVLNEDVTEIDSFQIEFTQVPPVTAGLLVDASGNVIADGAIFNHDETITFTPAESFSSCAPVRDFLLPLCTGVAFNPQVNFDDLFVFSIVFGEGKDTHVSPPLPFFFMVELRTVGNLIIASENIIFPVEDTFDSLIPFVLNASFVSVEVEEEEDVDRLILLSFTVVSQSDLTIRSQEGELFDLRQVSTITCDAEGDTLCRFSMLGTKDAINEALDENIVILDIATKDFEDTLIKVAINEVEEVVFIISNPLETFESISFGSRVFSINSGAFLSFKEGESAALISEGEAVLGIGPSEGKLKQPNCIDVVNVGDSIIFENDELSFCYEGGAQMLNGVSDTLTFNIIGDNGATSSIQPEFSGSDAINLVPLIDRKILVLQDQSGEFSGSHFAYLREGVNELDIFRIQFDTVPPNVLGTLTTSSGSLLGDRSVVSSDEIITLTPAKGVSFCAPLPVFPREECPLEDENPGENPSIPSFIFRIILGEDEDIFISEPLEFFYIVETAVANGELVVAKNNIPISYENIQETEFLIPLNRELLSVRLLTETDVDYLLSLTITIDNESALSLIVEEIVKKDIQAFKSVPCTTISAAECEVTLTGTVEEINRVLDSNYVTLRFDTTQVVTAGLRVELNQGKEAEYLNFVPLETSTSNSDPSLPLIVAPVMALFLMLLVVSGIVYMKRKNNEAQEETRTLHSKNPMAGINFEDLA